MPCSNVCRICRRLVISQSITFTDGNLIINIPAGNYEDGEKYCIVLAQTIPQTATINANVFITIGTGTQQYPLVSCSCEQITACGLRTRTKYATRVQTNSTSGVFRLFGNVSCRPNYDRDFIDGTAPTTQEDATELSESTGGES